jgi:hypothetical protein
MDFGFRRSDFFGNFDEVISLFDILDKVMVLKCLIIFMVFKEVIFDEVSNPPNLYSGFHCTQSSFSERNPDFGLSLLVQLSAFGGRDCKFKHNDSYKIIKY